jgi:hypothetical protein
MATRAKTVIVTLGPASAIHADEVHVEFAVYAGERCKSR